MLTKVSELQKVLSSVKCMKITLHNKIEIEMAAAIFQNQSFHVKVGNGEESGANR